MLNKEQIELLKKEIEFLETKIEEREELSKFIYDNNFSERTKSLIANSWDLKDYKEKLKNNLELYQMLTDEGIDTNKSYYLTDDIYLSINDLRPYFYMKNDGWIYDNYINSWSGINEWITDLIDSEHSLFSGNSPYCHAFNTMTIKEIFDVIESEKVENSRKLTLLENLIEFTKEDGKFKNIHVQVVKAINFKLEMMKDVIDIKKVY